MCVLRINKYSVRSLFRHRDSYLVTMYTLHAGRILIGSIITVCWLNLKAWKASWAHRTGENVKQKIMIK